MANTLYDPGREGILDDTISFTVAVIKVALIRGYTFSAAHKFMSDVTTAGATVVSTATLASKTATSGVADAADIAFTAVASGAACPNLVVYQSSAVTGGSDVASSSQRVIGYIDTATGLPVTPTGVDINVTWDNGSNKIFKL